MLDGRDIEALADALAPRVAERVGGPPAVLSPEQVDHVKRLAVRRLLLTKAEAAESLGMSISSFERYVMPDVKVVRQGALRLYPIGALEAWVEANAMLTLEGLE